MAKPSLKIFQKQSPTSSTAPPSTEPLYSYVTQNHIGDPSLVTSETVIGLSTEPKSAARFQVGRPISSTNSIPEQAPLDVAAPQQLPPKLAWQGIGIAVMSPNAVAKWEQPLPRKTAGPTPEGSQFHLVHVPDLGFPTSEIYDTPRELMRELKARIREAADTLAINQHAFYVYRGIKGVVYFDELTFDVAVEIDGKKLRPRLERLDEMTALENGQMPGASEEQSRSNNDSDSWDEAMGVELF